MTVQINTTAAKAYAQTDQTAVTQLVISAFNVSSVTDGGAGQSTFTLTTVMSNATYVCAHGGFQYYYTCAPASTSAMYSHMVNSTGNFADAGYSAAVAFGNLA